MGYGLVFAGQGTQHPAMLPWLGDDPILRGMCGRLGIGDWRSAVADAAWSERNAHAQVLLTGLALSAWHRIAADLPPPSAIAGYSVGEVAAFGAAGVFDADTALALAERRAQAMDRCAKAQPGGLLAVSGATPQAVDAACRSAGLAIAIRNGAGAVVLGGPLASVDAGERILSAQGGRCTRLRVAVASHTPWMQGAAADFRAALAAEPFHRPRVPLFSNTADRIHDPEAARQALAEQIASTVRWDDCMDNMRARQVACVLEVGPGGALARMWNERHPDVPARSCDEFRSAAAVVKWVSAAMGPAR
jgi:[acyl-carrier-protein] S-malonyltransferase